jgi:hypothetical protein
MLSNMRMLVAVLFGGLLHLPYAHGDGQLARSTEDRIAAIHVFMEKAALLNAKVIEQESIWIDSARKLVIKEQLAIDVSGRGFDYKRYEKPAEGVEYLRGDTPFTLDDFTISTRIDNLEKRMFLKKQEKVVLIDKVSKLQCARELSHLIKPGIMSPILKDVPGERVAYLRDRMAKLSALSPSESNGQDQLQQISRELEGLRDSPLVMLNFSMFPHTNTTPGRNTKFTPYKDGSFWEQVETYETQGNQIVGKSSAKISDALPPVLQHPGTWKIVKGITETVVEKTVKPPQDVKVLFGVTIEKLEGGDFGVISVKPGSIAEKAGMNPGDRIVEIDGVPAKNISQEMCSKLLWYNKRLILILENGKSVELSKD